MEEHAITYKRTYQEFKGELDYELNKAANGFVRIGFLLKQARDTDILNESPYSNYQEFAQKEYGLDASQVSRFININDRFAREDNPEKLKDEYGGFGVAKLSLMLTLPDALNEELSPEMSKSEIRTIKEEYEAEQKITPIEAMCEEPAPETNEFEFLEKLLFEIGRTETDMMAELFKEEGFTISPQPRKEMGILAPAGQKMYIARIPGMGKYSLNVKDGRTTVINMRDGSKEEYTAQHISEALAGLCSRAVDLALKDQDKYGENGIPDEFEMWALLYGSEFPKKDDKKQQIAPVQKKKESKVSVAKPAKSDAKKNAKSKDAEIKKAENDDFEPENDEKTAKNALSDEEMLAPEEEVMNLPEDEPEEEKHILDKNTIRGYKAGLSHDLDVCRTKLSENQWRALKTKLESMLSTVKRIIDGTEEGDGEV